MLLVGKVRGILHTTVLNITRAQLGTRWGDILEEVELLQIPGLVGRTWQQMFDKWRSMCKKTGITVEAAAQAYREQILNHESVLGAL